MSPPVDMQRFREAIGHDAEMERVLLRLFIETTDEAIAALSPRQPADAWREQLHLIKGAALNIGAAGLASAASDARTATMPESDAQVQAYEAVCREYAAVRDWLTSLLD